MRNHTRYVWVFAMAAWLALSPERAEAVVSPEAVFLEANEEYQLGRYDEAAARYEALLTRGVENGALYYNLGNAWLKGGRTGAALWAYRRAARLMPRDADLAANLEYARSLASSADAVSVKPTRLVRWLTLQQRFATGELTVAWIILLWLASGCWLAWIWGWGIRPVVGAMARWLTTAAVAALVVLTAQTIGVDAVATAVVVADDEVEVTFAPQDDATVHFALPEGAAVRLLQRQNGWAQVRRGDGRSGWLPESAVKPL